MPSPVGHALAGLIVAEHLDLDNRRQRLETVLWACAADIDIVPGLLRANPGAAHAKASHSIGAAVLAGVGAGLFTWWRRRSFFPRFTEVTVAYTSHLVLDYLGKESSQGGMMLFWPFSQQRVGSRYRWFSTILSESRERGFWKGLFLLHNMKAVAREVLSLGAFRLLLRRLKDRSRREMST